MTAPIVTRLGIADAPGSFVTRVVERLEFTWGGLVGDRHFGLTAKAGARQKHHARGTEIGNARQVSIVSEEELALIAAELGLPRLAPEWIGSNLCFQGLESLTLLAPSTRLLFPSGACLVVDGENRPCVHAGKEVQQQFPEVPQLAVRFVKAAYQRRGVVAWVERPGVVEQGAPVELIRR